MSAAPDPYAAVTQLVADGYEVTLRKGRLGDRVDVVVVAPDGTSGHAWVTGDGQLDGPSLIRAGLAVATAIARRYEENL